MSAYGNEHRVFVQGIMASGILDSREVAELYLESCEAFEIEVPSDKKDKMLALTEFIRTINRKLEPLCFEIVKAVDEDRRNRVCYYVFCNKSDRMADNPTFAKSAFDFNPNELDYLKLVMVGILRSGGKELNRTAAINLTSQVNPGGTSKRFTGADGEKAVAKFVKNKWLRYSDDGANIRLSPRFLVEMQPYLMRIREDCQPDDDDGDDDDEENPLGSAVAVCDLCNKMVIRSVGCGSCSRKFHLYCLNSRSDGASDFANCICNQELRLSNEVRQASNAESQQKRKRVARTSCRRRISTSSSSDE